jgi:NDP-sugar pyrophosphorylase family protein
MQVTEPTLLIIAAGMGSRYGGLKQIDSVGPHGEIIIDYSMHDALAAGFKKVVFVIRHSFEEAFKAKIGSKLDGRVETAYAFQELGHGLDGFPLPPEREKPWGTGHAILMARDLINEPFAVINADDYYGTHSFKAMKDYLSGPVLSATDYAMVGFKLSKTLSEHGSVARGVCQCEGGFLRDVVECLGIEKQGETARFFDDKGVEQRLSGDEVVSMNLWGFHPSIFQHLSKQFQGFLKQRAQELKSEFFIPTVVDKLVKDDQVRVTVLPTQDTWFGVTYPEDKARAERSIQYLIKAGVYPERLWGT